MLMLLFFTYFLLKIVQFPLLMHVPFLGLKTQGLLLEK